MTKETRKETYTGEEVQEILNKARRVLKARCEDNEAMIEAVEDYFESLRY